MFCRLLVYEFMKNGSLDKWIFPSYQCRDRLLDWPTRFNIAIATAQGIAYFHEQCRNRIIHCDIKPENILLDENFCPKVSDFGLAKLMGREHSHVVTMVRGTRGYLAPEWVSNRPITVKADVYSYGMLLLEIVGGRRNLDMSYDAEDFFYPGWAFKVLQKIFPFIFLIFQCFIILYSIISVLKHPGDDKWDADESRRQKTARGSGRRRAAENTESCILVHPR